MTDMMGATDVAFPNLGIYLNDLPKSFSIFGYEIALYGLIIGLGMVFGFLLAVRLAKKTGQNEDDYWTFIIFGILFGVAGARIYYVIFQWEHYKDNLLSIFNLRQGGLAIYGGVIAAFLTVYIFCKIKKLNPFLFGDTAVPGLILGQAIGRWGNFFNREVFGGYSDGPFAMRIPTAVVRQSDVPQSLRDTILPGTNYIQVHPTFLYECVWNLFILAILLIYRKHKKFHGELCLIYLGGYGIGRAIIESIRTDQLYIHGTTIPVSEVIGIACFVVALAIDIVVRIRISKKKVSSVETCEANSVNAEIEDSIRATEREDEKESVSEGREVVVDNDEAAEDKDADE